MADTSETLDWSLNVGARSPGKRLVVVALALAAALIGQMLLGPLMSVIGFFVVLVATADFFLPLKYRLDESGASVKCGLSVTAIRWSEVKRLIPMPDGVRLSPLDKPSRLDEFRGVYLRFSDNEAAVSGKIRQLWNGDTSPLERGTDGTAGGRTGEQSSEPDPPAQA